MTPIAVFILFIGFLLIIVIFSGYNSLQLVDSDYYDQGLNYQRQIERMQRGKKSGLQVATEYDKSEQRLTIRFPDTLNPAAISGTLIFFRPADVRQDKEIPVAVDHDNRQTIVLKEYSKGLWRVKIFWQQDTLEYYQEEILIVE
jgi:hypothetical protein